MLDRLRLYIPFKPEFVTGGEAFLHAGMGMASGHDGVVPDVLQFDCKVSGDIFRQPDGSIEHRKHRIVKESIPTSLTPMFFAAHACGTGFHKWPCVELRASPAKILQGHNLFGPRSIELGAIEMLILLRDAYPKLFAALDIRFIEVLEIDCTFFSRLDSDEVARQVLEVLKNVSGGFRRAKGNTFDTTHYWGAKLARLCKGKAYLKLKEFLDQLAEYEQKAKKDPVYRNLVKICSDPDLLEFAAKMLRFEATIMKRYFERKNIPTNLWALIDYQKAMQAQGKCLITELFKSYFEPIFQTFEGQTMRIHNDDEVRDALLGRFAKINSKGKVSHEAALAAFRTYRFIAEDGYEATKKAMSKTTFYKHIEMLVDCGVAKAYLQNLEVQRKTNNVYPLLRFINIDFSNQYPSGYVEPKNRGLLRVA